MVVGFNAKKEKFEKSPIVECNFTNAIFFGQTGSGKTTSAILPNIKNRMAQNHGVLIYDFKGNLHLQVKHLAHELNKLDEVYEIGVPWGSSTNLMKYLNSTNVATILDNLGNKHQEDYWNNAAKNLLSNIYGCHKYIVLFAQRLLDNPNLIIQSGLVDFKERLEFNIDHYEPSYKNIYNCISIPKNLETFYEKVENLINEYSKYLKEKSFQNISKRKQNMFIQILNSLQTHHQALGEYKTMNEEGSVGGKYGVLGVLNSILSEVATKDYLNTDEVDVTQLLRSGKTVIINVNNLSENIVNVINTMVYNDLQFMTYDENKPVTIFMDEAHKILHSNYLPQVDVCRESKFEYIFSTQDEVLVSNKVGEQKKEEMLSNIVEQYSYRTNYNSQSSNLEPFEYINLRNNRKAFAIPIFIDHEQLLSVEHTYQKNNKILKMADVRTNKVCRLVYIPKHLENMKVQLEFLDGEKILIDYYGKTIETKKSYCQECEEDLFIYGKKDDEYQKLRKDLNSCIRSVAHIINEHKAYSSKQAKYEDNFRKIFRWINELQLDMTEVRNKLDMDETLYIENEPLGEKIDLDRMARLLEEKE